VFSRVKVKMCGMTNAQDIAYASSLGVDAIGLIFYPHSKRFVTIEQAKALLHHLPLFVDVVAVMVNPLACEVEQVLEQLPIQWLQFHGEESPTFCHSFNIPYIKAIAADSTALINAAMQDYHSAAALLLDTPSTDRGGTGQTFDWHKIPTHRPKPIILAGGLFAGNVSQAIAACLPDGVDVCSGIEYQARRKDRQKMKAFVDSVNGKMV
jgi:phosphoribosylanthranilate isomerase